MLVKKPTFFVLYPLPYPIKTDEGFQYRMDYMQLNPYLKVLSMPKPSPSGGYRKMLRRSLLFLFGLAIAKLLSDFFSIEQNRNNFAKLVSQLGQQLIVKIESAQKEAHTKSLPNAPLQQTSITDQSTSVAPATQDSVTNFSKDPQKRVMGNMVAAGQFLKYSRWELASLSNGDRPRYPS